MFCGFSCRKCKIRYGLIRHKSQLDTLPKARSCPGCKRLVDRLARAVPAPEGGGDAFGRVQFMADHKGYFSLAMGAPNADAQLPGERYDGRGRLWVEGRTHRRRLMAQLGMTDD